MVNLRKEPSARAAKAAVCAANIANIRKSQPISRVLSWTVIHLGHASLHTSSNLPVFSAGRAFQLTPIEHLFGLAPSGVYLAASVTTYAVRSYRTISPLLSLNKNSNQQAVGTKPSNLSSSTFMIKA